MNKNGPARLTHRETVYLLSLVARERVKFENKVKIGGDNMEGAKKMKTLNNTFFTVVT